MLTYCVCVFQFTLLWIMWALMFKLFGSNTLPTLPASRVVAQYDALGPMSFQESMVLVHFVTLGILWVTQGFWSPLFKYEVDGEPNGFISSSTPAIFIALSLFVAPADKPNLTRK